MLDAGPTADLQHAGALGGGQGLAGRVGDLNRPPGPNSQPPDDPDEAHPEHTERIAADHPQAGLLQNRLLGRAWRIDGLKQRLGPARLLGQTGDFSPGLTEAEQGQHRQHQGQAVEDGGQAWIPGLEAQPEVETHAAVQPGQDELHGLGHAQPRAQHPVAQNDEGVGIGRLEPVVGQPGANDVEDQQRGDQKAEGELNPLAERQARVAVVVDRDQGQRHMYAQRAV